MFTAYTDKHKRVVGASVFTDTSSVLSKASSSASATVGNPDGVLLVIKGLPLAWYDIPTANKMTYPKALWDVLFDDPDWQTKVNTQRRYYGEDDHYDDNHVKTFRATQRFVNIKFGDKPNQVIGDVEILDNVGGRHLFSMARGGGLGFSTRGLAVFLPDPSRGSDYVILEPETYFDICIDAVVDPAVSDAMFVPTSYVNEHDEAILAASGYSPKAFRKAVSEDVKILVLGKYAGSSVKDNLLIGICDDVSRGALPFEEAVAVSMVHGGDVKSILSKQGFDNNFVVALTDNVSALSRILTLKK